MKKKSDFLRFFIRGLHALLASNIPLLAGLRSLAAQEERQWARRLIAGLAAQVASGHSLSEAMEQSPRYFSSFITGLILVGEQTGTLAESLGRLADYLDESARLRMRIYGALTYPAFLLAVTLTGAILLVKIFVPAFEPVFADLRGTLPFPTRLLLFSYALISSPAFWLAFAATGGAGIALTRFTGTRKDTILLKTPYIGLIMKKGILAQTASTLAIAHSCGLPLAKGLELAESMTSIPAYKELIRGSRLAVAQGEPLSSFFLENPDYVSPMVGHMMAVAESTGQLDRLLFKCSRILEDEVAYQVQRFALLVEPGILLLLGGVVGFIMLGAFLPLYEMLRLIQ